MSAETTQDPPSSPIRIWGPLLVILAMLAWSNIPPYRAHIKHEKRALFVWHWRLYEHGGGKVCDIRYYDMKQDGQPIERWKLLGYERPGTMPDKLGRIHHNQLFNDYQRVCQAMRDAGDPNPDVQVYARCGIDLGWQEVERRKRNVCKIRAANQKKLENKLQTKP